MSKARPSTSLTAMVALLRLLLLQAAAAATGVAAMLLGCTPSDLADMSSAMSMSKLRSASRSPASLMVRS